MHRSKAWAWAKRVGIALEAAGLATGGAAFALGSAPGWLLAAAAAVGSGAALALVAGRRAAAAREAEEDAVDRSWLLARARGEAAEHPDPKRAAAYARLESAIANLPPREPPAGFEAEVFAKVDAETGANPDKEGKLLCRTRTRSSLTAGASSSRAASRACGTSTSPSAPA